MKVLYINTFDVSGGAEQICLELFMHQPEAHMIVKNKFSSLDNIRTFPAYTVDKVFFTLDKILFRFGIQNRLKSKLFIAEELNQTYKKLSRQKAYQEADIIHLHNIHGGYFDLNALEKIAAEKKIVWTLHDMWAMTGGESYTFENENYKIGIGKTPYNDVQPLNNPLLDRRQHYLERKKEIYARISDQITFVPVSKWLERCLRGSYVYHPNMKIVHINNGYDATLFCNQRKRNGDKPGILFFNSKQSYKGSKVFTSVAAEYTDIASITYVGVPLNLPGITNIPYVQNKKEMVNLYNEHDILILPSLAESFSLVALEAMACGMCVIASDCGALPERINSDWGYLFKAGNSDDLKEKINRAIQHINKTRLMGEIAAEEAKKFTFDIMIEKYHQLYQSIV